MQVFETCPRVELEMPHSFVNMESNAKQRDVWHKYQVSPEVMAMTFEERKDIPKDYDFELQKDLIEKYRKL